MYQLGVVTVAKLLKYEIKFHHHSYAYLTKKNTAMQLITWIGCESVEHIVLSSDMCRRLRDRYPQATNVIVCSNAAVLPETRSALGSTEEQLEERHSGHFVLGHISNLSVAKGINDAIECLRHLKRSGVPARLLLAGPESDTYTSNLIRLAEAEFGSDLKYLGPLNGLAIQAFYHQIDLFVFPSLYKNEAEPLVVLEASSWGVPSLAFDVGCLSEIVLDKEWLVGPQEDFPRACHHLVTSVLNDSTKRTAIRRRVRDTFALRQAEARSSLAVLINDILGESTQ